MSDTPKTPAGAVRTDAGGRPVVSKTTGRPSVPGAPAKRTDEAKAEAPADGK